MIVWDIFGFGVACVTLCVCRGCCFTLCFRRVWLVLCCMGWFVGCSWVFAFCWWVCVLGLCVCVACGLWVAGCAFVCVSLWACVCGEFNYVRVACRFAGVCTVIW